MGQVIKERKPFVCRCETVGCLVHLTLEVQKRGALQCLTRFECLQSDTCGLRIETRSMPDEGKSVCPLYLEMKNLTANSFLT